MSGLVLKSPAEIKIMDQANQIVQDLLDDLSARVRPGMTTMEIDAFAEKRIREAGGTPAFKGYPHRGDGRDFPGTVCALATLTLAPLLTETMAFSVFLPSGLK